MQEQTNSQQPQTFSQTKPQFNSTSATPAGDQNFMFNQLFGQLMMSQQESKQLSMQLVHEKDNHKNLGKAHQQLQNDYESLQNDYAIISEKCDELQHLCDELQQKPRRKRKMKSIDQKPQENGEEEGGEEKTEKKHKQEIKLRECNRCGIKNNKVRFARSGNMCQYHRTTMTKLYTQKRKLQDDSDEQNEIEEQIKKYNVFRDQSKDNNIDQAVIDQLQSEITDDYNLDPEDEEDQKYLALKD